MSQKSYRELLRDPRWQRRRLEIMQRASFRCESCLAGDKTLNVHHRIYRRGADPWEYADHELTCLCEQCHETEHQWRQRLQEALAQLRRADIEQVIGFAEGLVHLERWHEQPTAQLVVNSYEHATGLAAAASGSLDVEEVFAACGGSAQSGYTISAIAYYTVMCERIRRQRQEDA